MSSGNVDPSTLMIGVSGMRGVVGGSLSPATVTRMAGAFAAFVKQQPPIGERHTIALGRDSRPSGTFMRDLVVGTLTACGLDVVDLGVVTTPGVAMMTEHLNADAGIVVTASHNPIVWNGLKFLQSSGVTLPADAAARLRQLYDAGEMPLVPVDEVRPSKSDPTTHAVHVKRVAERVDVLGISSKRFKVVCDSVNGAGGVTSGTLLSKLGTRLAHIHSEPTGQFAHEPEPTAANLTGLCAEVRRQRADVGFAQDPDADRLAIVDENGTYIGEEYTLALCALHICRKKPGTTIVSNLSTSRMIDDVAAQHGGQVVRTPVGEANVIQKMLDSGSIIGGEGNGGVIDPRIVPGRDSLVAMAYVLQLMADTGKKLSELVAQIPSYAIVKDKLPLAKKEDAAAVIDTVSEHFANENQNAEDGLRIDWPDGWVSVRASNTEPILRIIAEAPTEEAASARISEVRRIAEMDDREF
jgi:phosphomannomutase